MFVVVFNADNHMTYAFNWPAKFLFGKLAKRHTLELRRNVFYITQLKNISFCTHKKTKMELKLLPLSTSAGMSLLNVFFPSFLVSSFFLSAAFTEIKNTKAITIKNFIFGWKIS